MKIIFLGLVFMLFFLPQVSFAANQNSVGESPALAAFIKQQDAASLAFFQQQAVERAAFMKANPDIIAKLDQQGKAMMAQRYAQSHQGFSGNTSSALSNSPPPVVDSTYAAFMAKQQSEKVAFLQQQAQAKQSFLSSQ